MIDRDNLHRFLFEELGIRGELVQLDASWQAVLTCHDYPSAVQSQLGQALVATVLLSATIKFKGSLILQAQSEGPLKTLVAQATHHRTVRGLARWNGEVPRGSLPEIYGSGRLVLTIQTEGKDPYQGIVSLEGTNLAEALQTYFSRSEQLQTRLWLFADEHRAVGLFLQELPSQPGDETDWERITLLANTVTAREMLSLPSTELLYRLFNGEQLRLFEPEPISFRCGCSRERIENTLVALGREEMEAILEEEGTVEVDCEFCNRHYSFDRVDVEQLFAEQVKTPVPSTRH
ncbi:Hsp33 protein [Nitrosococcus halophilus Nc 4]|uniref:33 kDa chaperonin n=1 Tax=Nitrosococcus halophilus (strain Nc4) TaxID=472759 RepID=D5C3M0_NITHN|nr:Hsp33 family molecular chaperone HslO [Nitrosococcus halophilus]ADE14992.1 Hsp33 protein [Nitrosococcus halophilus Nc 4]